MALADDRVWDFGDAPDPPFPTLAASNRARRTVGRLCLGSGVGPEANGLTSADARGDDAAGLGDDEDGVAFTTPINPDSDAGVAVTVSLACRLDGWLDDDGPGSWAEPGVSLGCQVTSDGREEFVARSARTFGVDEPLSVEQFRPGHRLPPLLPPPHPVSCVQAPGRPGARPWV